MKSSSVISQIKSARVPTLVPRVASIKKPTALTLGCSMFPCGEIVGKNHKCLSATGSIEELIGLIGRLKATHFNLEDTNARKMFIFARLTKIQEDLQCIIKSILTTPLNASKHSSSRFSIEKVNEIESATSALNSSKYTIGISGSTLIESDLYYVWSIVRRCERQTIGAKDPQLGIVVEESVVSYLNKLSDYFLCLITHMATRF